VNRHAGAVSWAALTLFWLLLVNEVSIAQLMLGLVLAGLVLLPTAGFQASRPGLRRVGPALQLLGVFGYDIILANVAVARAALSPKLPINPQFMRLPLDMEDPGMVALLAAMITLTPGTVSVDIDLSGRVLTIHGLLVHDAHETVMGIKRRYERRIREIFGC